MRSTMTLLALMFLAVPSLATAQYTVGGETLSERLIRHGAQRNYYGQIVVGHVVRSDGTVRIPDYSKPPANPGAFTFRGGQAFWNPQGRGGPAYHSNAHHMSRVLGANTYQHSRATMHTRWNYRHNGQYVGTTHQPLGQHTQTYRNGQQLVHTGHGPWDQFVHTGNLVLPRPTLPARCFTINGAVYCYQ